MPRSATTALYTRVDNSFSNPIVGTTISPTHADTFFDDVEAAVNAFIATSASSVAIGTGAKTFTVAADIANKVFIAGTFVHIYSRADTADFMFGSVTSYSTSTGALVVDVTATGGSGTNTDWNIYQAGARGATGTTGSTGATGATSGIKQAYSTTTTDADPGNGTFRLNHATPASATAAYLDNLDAGGATVSGIFDLFDDSTTTTKGFIRFEKSTDPTVWAQFAVTGSVVDGTGYRKVTLASGAGSGAFTDTDTFAISFFRTGDKGADGTIAGSTGATDNRVLRADGVGGATVQSSAVTIDDSGNVTGVAAIDVASIAVYGNVPQNSKSAAYTTVLSDSGKHIFHPAADTTARIWTIDSNANVAYAIGTAITFINQNSGGVITIAITSDTMRLAGAGTTGSRTLAANGVATAIKIATTEWIISGTGLT
jgi:hypothetical protein